MAEGQWTNVLLFSREETAPASGQLAFSLGKPDVRAAVEAARRTATVAIRKALPY